MKADLMNRLICEASAWQARNPQYVGGVVFVSREMANDGPPLTAVGWGQLGALAPQSAAGGWQPGVFAVAPDGRIWIAAGGNDRDGAKRWDVCPDVGGAA